MWRKALALGLMLMAIGVVVGGISETARVVWYVTHSEALSGATATATAGVIGAMIKYGVSAGIIKTALGLGFATVGGVALVVGTAL
ncbi:hypothetical protein E3E22_07155 [Thermococcus sp. MV5]|uniref:hypothetical protein n=1 Tax=Thermococcus sp. MV5 TaxID=1638272 RepID=UPI00143B8171|nr:hypothetical protein [Thermococcus sp. MV5]NJE26398.1 hypothetical protein [Thermococcus sp. MV5]